MPESPSQAVPPGTARPAGWELGALRSRLGRFAGYTFWSGAAVALPLALDRLLVSPWLNGALGETLFGGFVWALGIVNLCGLPVAAGVVSHLMRQHAEFSGERAQSLLRTATALGCVACGVLVVAGSLACLSVADPVVLDHAAAIFVPLSVFAILRCMETILIAVLRIRRRFVAMFLLKVLEAVLLLGVIWAYAWGGLTGVGTLYAVSVAAPLVLAVWMIRHELGAGSWWDGPLARAIGVAVPALALTGLIEQALFYFPRLVLGAFHSTEEVTLLFAGASIGALFLTPVSLSSGVILAILAPRRDFALHGRLGWIYLGLALLGGVVLGAASFWIGGYLVELLYPAQAERALSFYHWIALANGFTAAIVLLRPVTIRYAATRSIVGLSIMTVLLQLALLVWWVPREAAAGAARAAAIASALGLLCWMSNYVRLVLSSVGPTAPPAAIPEAAE